MTDILALLQSLSPCLTKTTIRQLSVIVPALLAMTGRVTMLGISARQKGGSYRPYNASSMQPFLGNCILAVLSAPSV